MRIIVVFVSGGVRTIIVYQAENNTFFVYGFAKNEKANIEDTELRAFKLLATELLSYDVKRLEKAVISGELVEVKQDD